MKKVAARFAGVALLALACASSHAAFHARDSAFGENTLVWDEDSGVQWLSLNVTRGQSYNSVFENLGTTYAGFHIASHSDLSTLMANIGVMHESRPLNGQAPSREHIAYVNQTLLQLGGVEHLAGVGLRGFSDWGDAGYVDFETNARTGSIFLEGFGAYTSGQTAAYYDDALYFYKPTPYASHGVFLVTAPVPEPGTYALLFAGLVGVAAYARRRKF